MAKTRRRTAADTPGGNQEARDRRMDKTFAGKPTLKQLRASCELSGDPLPASVFHQLRRLRARLRQERERQGLSQEALARTVGIDGPALSRIEGGRVAQPTLATLSRIAEALGLDLVVSLAPSAGAKRPI